MHIDLSQKRVIVTGAARGIGRAIGGNLETLTPEQMKVSLAASQ